MAQTPGKGPFSRRTTTRPKFEAPRWSAPAVDLDADKIRELLLFVQKQNDVGVYRFFKSLGTMEPCHRLARNLTELIRRMAAERVDDVLKGGLSELENSALMSLEQWGVPIAMLGVAHALLNIRERRSTARHLDDLFFQVMHSRRAKIDAEVLADLIERRREK